MEELENELWRRWSEEKVGEWAELYLRHSSFSNPSFTSPTSQALHLIHLVSRPWKEPLWRASIPGIYRIPRYKMCPDFYLGCCLGSHCCSHSASMLTYVCSILPSRDWSTGVCKVHRPLLKALTLHWYIVPNTCNNPSICRFRFPQAYSATPFKWLKLFNRSTYSSAGPGCTLEWMLQTLFTSQSSTVTACRVKIEGAKTDFLIANDHDKWIT